MWIPFAALMLPIALSAQIVSLRPVKVDVRVLGTQEVIVAQFYRGSKWGYDLYSHKGNHIRQIEVIRVRISEMKIDTLIIPKIIADFNRRESYSRQVARAQWVAAGISLVSVKFLADTKFDWK